jgi:hypothetical protein
MTETLLELETRLVQAKEARHRLLTGSQEVSVSLQGYGSTTYTAANVEALERYINELELQISRAKGGARRGVSGWQAKAAIKAISNRPSRWSALGVKPSMSTHQAQTTGGMSGRRWWLIKSRIMSVVQANAKDAYH